MLTWAEISARFEQLAHTAGRTGVIAAVQLERVRLLPQQERYLSGVLAPMLPKPHSTGHRPIASSALGGGCRVDITAVSLGLAYDRSELEGIPDGWAESPDRDAWNEYSRAYGRLNDALDRVAMRLAADFGGIAQGPTLEGRANQVKHVSEYYPHCISHRAVAAVAGLGWLGRHGLIVTPEFGPALRLSTVFLPATIEAERRDLGPGGCGSCRACLDACPVLERAASQTDPDLYRQGCLRRIRALALEADVCGICVKACLGR